MFEENMVVAGHEGDGVEEHVAAVSAGPIRNRETTAGRRDEAAEDDKWNDGSKSGPSGAVERAIFACLSRRQQSGERAREQPENGARRQETGNKNWKWWSVSALNK